MEEWKLDPSSSLVCLRIIVCILSCSDAWDCATYTMRNAPNAKWTDVHHFSTKLVSFQDLL